jgi:hypothetical protein
MPTILITDGFRFFFFSNESSKPPHVHVEYGDCLMKVWLESVEVARNFGFGPKEIRFALEIVRENQPEFLEKWREHFDKR